MTERKHSTSPSGSTSPINRRRFLRWSAVSAAGVASATTAQRLAADEPADSKPIRMGVVGGNFGCGFFWHEHPDCVVTGVSDLIPERRERLMKTYGCEKAYESLEKLILADDIDAVAIFTPVPDHARHIKMVLNAGKHAICAVPLGTTVEECESVLDTVKRTGLTYMMAETSFYRQPTITARQWYREGKFGEMIFSEGMYYHDHVGPRIRYWNDPDGPTWRYGFSPLKYITHCTAFLTGVTGERFTAVSAQGWGDDSEVLKKNVYDNPFWNGTALLRTNRGHHSRMSVFWNAQTGFQERANWFGTKRSFYMDNPNGCGAVITTADNPSQPYEVPNHWATDMLPEPLRHDSGHGGSRTFITHEFIDALIRGRRPAIDIYEALAETVPGIVAHESALKGGELLKVPLYEPA